MKGLSCAVSHAITVLPSWKTAACRQLRRCDGALGGVGTNDFFPQAKKLIFAIKATTLEVLLSGKWCRDAK